MKIKIEIECADAKEAAFIGTALFGVELQMAEHSAVVTSESDPVRVSPPAADEPEAPAADEPAKKRGRPVASDGPSTGDLTAAVNRYISRHGKPAGKALLAYFGATAVRSLPRETWPAVIAMCDRSPDAMPAPAVEADEPEAAPPTREAITPPPPADNSNDDSDDDNTPTPTADQLRSALNDHKGRHGLPATLSLVQSLGWQKPSEIPADKYAEVIAALKADAPEGAQIDLGMFE